MTPKEEEIVEQEIVDEPQPVDMDAMSDLDEEGSKELATVGETSAVALGSVSGDVDSDDVIIPYLTLVHPTSRLCGDDFSRGDWAYANELKLAKMGEKFSFICLSIEKYFEEVIRPFNPEARPRTFGTKKDLFDAGFTLKWDDGKPTCREVAKLTMLIEKPESLESTSFMYEFNGKAYAPAMWYARSSAYPVAKRILSAMALDFKGSPNGVLSGVWELHSKMGKSGGNDVALPAVRLAGKTDEALIEYIKATLG